MTSQQFMNLIVRETALTAVWTGISAVSLFTIVILLACHVARHWNRR